VTDLDEAIEEAVRSTTTYREAADALNLAGYRTYRGTPWTADTLSKRLVRHGRRSDKPPKVMDARALERLAQLGIEGLPGTWIAEDLRHFTADAVRTRLRRVPGRKDIRAEWYPVWKQIAASERLLELHREFAPKSGSRFP
jgi:hypothetical protein